MPSLQLALNPHGDGLQGSVGVSSKRKEVLSEFLVLRLRVMFILFNCFIPTFDWLSNFTVCERVASEALSASACRVMVEHGTHSVLPTATRTGVATLHVKTRFV